MSPADTVGNTQVSLAALPSVCGSLCRMLLHNSLPPSWFYSSCALHAGFLCKASCVLVCRCPLCCVAGKRPACWQQRGARPGQAANAAARVQSVWGISLGHRGRGRVFCFLKGCSCGSSNILGQGDLRQTWVIQVDTLRPEFISTYRTTFFCQQVSGSERHLD